MLRGDEPRKVLQSVLEKRIPAIMSYLSGSRWHLARALLTNIGDDRFDIKVSPRRKSRQINIQVNQQVGISLKYGYGYDKFVFDTTVVEIEPSTNPMDGRTIMLAVPKQIERVQRRSYYRIKVPSSLDVNVKLWHRGYPDDPDHVPAAAVRQVWQGRLVDISAGGLQVAINSVERLNFRKGQSIGLRFTPLPYETPLMFNAYIRNVLPTAADESVCLGLQMIGLEASPEGRLILQRLCNVVEQYHQMNQSNTGQQNVRPTNL